MADTSGAYATFIGAPFATRDGSAVLIRTPDLRLPQGATRAAQQLDTPYAGTSFVANRYFNNRQAADDFPGDGWGTSNYDHKRVTSRSIRASGVGPAVQFALAEGTRCSRPRATSTLATLRRPAGAADRCVACEARPAVDRRDHQCHAGDRGQGAHGCVHAGSAGAWVQHDRMRHDSRSDEVGKENGDGLLELFRLVPGLARLGRPAAGHRDSSGRVPKRRDGFRVRSRSTTWADSGFRARLRRGRTVSNRRVRVVGAILSTLALLLQGCYETLPLQQGPVRRNGWCSAGPERQRTGRGSGQAG